MVKFNKMTAAVVAALAIGTIGTGAYASTYKLSEYENDFSFDFNGHGGTQFSSKAPKRSSSTYDAKVQATGGYVSEENKIFVDVSYIDPVTNKRVIATEEKEITSPTDHRYLEYIVPRGEGSMNFLVGSGTYYGAEVVGTWEP